MNQQIQDALNWRYATKVFDPALKISPENWSLLEDSLVKAPSSYGLQPFKFLVIENPELRQKLRAVSWNQGQVTDASHYVVLLSKEQMDTNHIDTYLQRIAEVRGVSMESLQGFRAMMIENLLNETRLPVNAAWAQRQTYIAMGFLMETAALLKIDACPIEGFDPAAYDKLLNLENSGWKSVATVALGYRHADDSYQNLKKVRLPTSALVQHIK